MPKAKEWAERFETASDLGAELQLFVGEIGAIAAARGDSLNAVEGAVREQKAKFMAACNHTGVVTPALWPALMKAHGQNYMADVRAYLRQGKPSPRKGGKGGWPGTSRRRAD